MANEFNLYILKTIQLNNLEKSYSLHGNWSSIVHIAHFSQTDSRILTKNLHYIIKQLLKKHPRLRSRIRIIRSIYHQQINEQHLLDLFDYDDELYSRLDILKNFYSFYYENENWMKIAEDLSNQNPYNHDLTCIFPLFHFSFIINHDNIHLILLTNHSISDGQSGYIILHDYLTLATQEQLIEWKINQNLSPNLLDLIPKPYQYFYPFFSKLYQIIYCCQRKSYQINLSINSNHLNDNQYLSIQPIYTHFLFTSCSKEHYQQFRNISHQYNLKLHGPLFACLVLAIRYSFPSENFDIQIDYNMRHHLPTSIFLNETVGFYVGVSSIDLSNISLKMKFWSFAKYCSQETNKKFMNKELSLSAWIFSDIIENNLIDQSINGKLSEINYSNLGKYSYDIKQYKNIHLDGIHLASNSSIYHTLVIYLTCVQQIDISLSHHYKDFKKLEKFFYLYQYLIELSVHFHENQTLEDIFNLLKTY